jgi:phage virion morphogenesis protein
LEKEQEKPTGVSTLFLQKRGWLCQTFFANPTRTKVGFYFCPLDYRSIEIDTERVQTLLQRLIKSVSPTGFADTMTEIGEDLVYSTRQRFVQGVAPDGSRWDKLSPVTLALGIKRGRRGDKPLIDTGTLEQSVHYDVLPDGLRIGVNRQYKSGAHAGVHQFGTHRAGRGNKVTLSARPFLELSDDDVDKIERTIIRAIRLEAGAQNSKETARPQKVRKHPPGPPPAEQTCVWPKRRQCTHSALKLSRGKKLQHSGLGGPGLSI